MVQQFNKQLIGMVKAAVRQEVRVVVIREVVIMKAVITEVVSRMEEAAGLDSHLVGYLVEGFLAGFLVLRTDFPEEEVFLGAEAFLEAEVFLVEAASRQVVGDWTLDSWRLVDNDWALPAGH